MRLTVITLASTLAFFAQSASAQTTSNESSEGRVKLAHLALAPYPKVARTAHITGDVDLTLEIGKDGTVESATVVSGPPLLAPAALASARGSQFECINCSEAIKNYRLVYTFNLDLDPRCELKGQNDQQPPDTYPKIAEAPNRITITDESVCIIDPITITKKRSWKCLYLWRCSSHREG